MSLEKKNHLPLLDDDFAFGFSLQEESRLATLIRHRIAHPKPSLTPLKNRESVASVVAPIQSQLQSVLASTPRKKHFSSRPDLRKMMNEYNRPRTTSSPLKSGSVDSRTSQIDFKAERLDFIDLPNIPGRVLRPQKS